MFAVPQSKIAQIIPLIKLMLEEGNLLQRTTVEYDLARLLQGYVEQNIDAYVDSLEDPKRVVIFGRGQGVVTNEKIIRIYFMYATPELRNEETRELFRVLIDYYCKQHPWDALLASDWQFGGCQMGTGAFLRFLGFERQEVVYCKLKPR